MISEGDNGGFPQPPAGEPVRVVSSKHGACGTHTQIRLPGELPAGVVRRVVCAGCGTAYEPRAVEEIETPGEGAPPPAGWLDRSPGRLFRIAAIPIAAAAVIGTLLVIRALGG